MSQFNGSSHPTSDISKNFDVYSFSNAQSQHDDYLDAPSAPAVSHPTDTKSKKRRPSKSKPGKQLGRSHSTPLLHGPAMSESDADKKRNKLGYQRISVACTHCRRRKIRCLPPEDASQAKCQNCVRLDKECEFSPVDQHNVGEATPESSNKRSAPSAPSSARSVVSSSSPPQLATAQSLGRPMPYGAFPNIQPNIQTSFHGDPIAMVGNSPAQSNYAGRDPFYTPQSESPSSWTQAQEFVPTHGLPMPLSSPVNHQHNYMSPATSVDYAPMSGSFEQQSSQPMEQFGNTPYMPNRAWQQPMRAMTYPDFAQPNHYSPSFQSEQAPGGAYRFSGMQDASIQAHRHDPHYVAQPDSTPGQQIPYGQQGPDPRAAGIPYMQAQQIPTTWHSAATAFGPGHPYAHPHPYQGQHLDSVGYSTGYSNSG